ncbi:hypothetical protein [Halobacillus salinus]|uniref:Uncharacterized protein n=1 Tax=Halobacillus salinus TaxID=192814 RepID=A0A4Z0H2T9_9BACI|nr:hypothetical protein [Halobacillus salinus]TGB03485.1 hypothetical protein E4663_00310 [Halobacillus salinus]
MKNTDVAIRSSVVGAAIMVLVFLFQTWGALEGNVVSVGLIYVLTFIMYFMLYALFFFVVVVPLDRWLAGRLGVWARFAVLLGIGLGICVVNLVVGMPYFEWMGLVENVGLLVSTCVAVVSYYFFLS